MLRTYPKDLGGVDREKLRDCIEACLDCSQTCTACADACLSEDMVAELTKCIRTCTDCSDVCDTTGRVLSRHTGYDANLTRAVLEACAAACKACGDECARPRLDARALPGLFRGLPALRGRLPGVARQPRLIPPAKTAPETRGLLPRPSAGARTRETVAQAQPIRGHTRARRLCHRPQPAATRVPATARTGGRPVNTTFSTVTTEGARP